MKIKHLSTLFLLGLALSVSCKKEDKPAVGGPDAFSYQGISFYTLQDAIKAAACTEGEDFAVITLNSDVTDNGACFPTISTLNVKLDLGNKVYTLNPGKSIDVGNNALEICGDGGGIATTSDAFAFISSKNGLIRYDGNLSLQAENMLKSSSPVVVGEDFNGSINGNVTLDKAQFHILSDKCVMNVPALSVNGEDAVFSVDFLNETSSPAITIGEVTSDRKYPVTAVKENAAKVASGKVHVHNFKSCKIEGSCTVPDAYVLECEECGFTTIDDGDHEITYGECNPQNLIKHERKDATDCEFGNIEYYECPDCGRCYSDADCNTECTGEIMIIPSEYDDIMNMSVGVADWGADLIMGLISLIPTIISSEYQMGTTPVAEFKKFSERITQISGKLDTVQRQIKNIAEVAKTIPYQIKVLDRMATLKTLYGKNDITFKAIKADFDDPKYSQKQKDSLKAIYVRDWSGKSPGSKETIHPHEMVLGLMTDYSSVSVGPDMPQMYGEVLSSYYLWEHFGYPVRTLMLSYDFVVTAVTYYLAQNYTRVNRTFASDVMRTAYIKGLEAAFDNYCKTLVSEFNRMKDRGEKYRRYMPTNTTMDINVFSDFDFISYFEGDTKRRMPRDDKYVSINTCNELMNKRKSGKEKNLIGSSFMESYMAYDTYKYYLNLKNKKKLPQGYPENLNAYGVLDSLGFKGVNQGTDFRLLFNSPQTFSYENGDIQYPKYWNIWWRSYKGSLCNDYVNVGPVLKNDGTSGPERLINCNISVVCSGLVECISVPDAARKLTFGAILVTDQGQKPETK